ncbi:hypothetical protein [Tellurirhabdus bombi]|uniref:hypothetical protein n=1 Tax=Tellurirhabdus bombi TaxID=2907205 RepID=UPI001F31AA0C|nr:hypothetical protein [Tellurirhabdus bombi]
MKPVNLLSSLFLYWLLSLTLGTSRSEAQKVDLDRFYFDVSYLALPKEYVEPSYRTFGVHVNAAPSIRAAFSESAIYDRINVFGFQRVESAPTVGVQINLGELRFEKSEPRTRVEEKKQKNGQVSKTTYYSILVRYSISGGYKIYGPKTGEAITQKTAEKKEAKPNRFLQNVIAANEAPFSQNLMASYTFPYELTYTTREYTNPADASRYLDQNQQSIRAELITKYVNDGLQTVNNSVNTYYGYVPVQSRDFLWILDSKTHPEYEVQQEAIKAVKELMRSMQATQSLEVLTQNLQPLLAYFQELKTKYTGSDKREAKMRYSAYYNLAVLYLYLDQPGKAAEAADGLIKNDYDASDGKSFLKQATELKATLEKHHLDSRHMAI